MAATRVFYIVPPLLIIIAATQGIAATFLGLITVMIAAAVVLLIKDL